MQHNPSHAIANAHGNYGSAGLDRWPVPDHLDAFSREGADLAGRMGTANHQAGVLHQLGRIAIWNRCVLLVVRWVTRNAVPVFAAMPVRV